MTRPYHLPATAAASPSGVGDRRLRVLVVDDNRDGADSLATLVRLWGHEAQVAYDGQSAFALACTYKPQVLLLDLALPKVNGLQLATLLRQQDGLDESIYIALTGYADQDHRLQCFEAGFDHHLSKTIDVAEVENLLRVIDRTFRLGKPNAHDTLKAGNTLRVNGNT